MERILLVEDDPRQQRALAQFLQNHGYQVLAAASAQEAGRLLDDLPDVIVTDLRLPDGSGLDLLRLARQELPETPVLVTTGYGTVSSAVQAMKEGALDFLSKPVEPEALLLAVQRAAERTQLQREVRRLRQQLGGRAGLAGMVGTSPAMRQVFEQIELAAPTRSTVLITGESGTGKELVARALHQLSPRRQGPFVALNCAAIPKDLAESELFGHVRGAFTGAIERRVGKFAAAHQGTLLVDEIAEMELPIQAKLLRAIETRAFAPVGATEEQAVDVRVVAATHRPLKELVEAGKFREDLYYRLNVVHIRLPPLRERREDIPLLAATFLAELAKEHHRAIPELSPDALEALQRYRWPGNVRELRNMLEGLVVLSRKPVLTAEDLPPAVQQAYAREGMPSYHEGMTLEDLERQAIQHCLNHTRGNRQRAARLLGISTRTLQRKIQQYRLHDPRQQHQHTSRLPPESAVDDSTAGHS